MNATVTTSQEMIVEMIGVTSGSMRDPDAAIVRDVNWSVTTGDFWIVAGLQGVGKSDFLMMTAGLLPPSSGTLRLFGDAMPVFEENRKQQRLKLGFVFDDGHLFHHLTIAENISLPMRYHGDFAQDELAGRTHRLLELTELMPFANNTPGTIGRNWRKRAGLARALGLQPELLLVDNPLNGSDPRHAEWWTKILGELARGHDWMPNQRVTTLVVTADDSRPWQKLARQFAVLRGGKLEIGGNFG